jgi:hypothetical protein
MKSPVVDVIRGHHLAQLFTGINAQCRQPPVDAAG